MIDEDLGRSGSGLVERAGFEIQLPNDVPQTPAPDDALVALLRTMDPNGVYLRQSKTPSS